DYIFFLISSFSLPPSPSLSPTSTLNFSTPKLPNTPFSSLLPFPTSKGKQEFPNKGTIEENMNLCDKRRNKPEMINRCV
ncbi:hypothetical protein COCMIDRAFT_107578, partial [Bipolaris oryzae ATCC 44560]